MALTLNGSDPTGDLGDLLDAKVTTPGAWTSFTPVISFNGGSGWTVTTSSITGGYSKVGRTVNFYSRFVVTAFTVGSTGVLSISLPVAMKQSNLFSNIHCQLFDTSAFYTYGGVVTQGTSNSIVAPCFRLKDHNHAGWPFYNGSPIVSAAAVEPGDYFTMAGTYEAAS